MAEPVYISAITASELLHGVERANSTLRRDRRRLFVEAVFRSVNVVGFDLEVARTHAEVWADLRRRGMLISAHDLLIAATAIQHQLILATYNFKEFQRIDDLTLLELS